MIFAVLIAFVANHSIVPATLPVNSFALRTVMRIVRMSPIPKIFNIIHGKKSSIPEIPISCEGLSIQSLVTIKLIHVLFPSLDVFIPMAASEFHLVSHSLSTERKTMLMLIANVAITGRKIVDIILPIVNFSIDLLHFPRLRSKALLSMSNGENAIPIHRIAILMISATHKIKSGTRYAIPMMALMSASMVMDVFDFCALTLILQRLSKLP